MRVQLASQVAFAVTAGPRAGPLCQQMPRYSDADTAIVDRQQACQGAQYGWQGFLAALERLPGRMD
jgi:hypothetical protein